MSGELSSTPSANGLGWLLGRYGTNGGSRLAAWMIGLDNLRGSCPAANAVQKISIDLTTARDMIVFGGGYPIRVEGEAVGVPIE